MVISVDRSIGERNVGRRRRMPAFRRTHAGVLLSLAVLIAAIAAATFAHPVVGTFELQRRDRLPSALPTIAPDDTLGRVGFVLMIAGCLGLIWALHLRASRMSSALRDVYLPPSVVVGLFGVFTTLWFLYQHLVLDAFARGKFGYLEWLSQITNLANARGIWNVWTPYPQGTQEVIVSLQAISNALGGLSNSDVWTGYTIFRLTYDLLFLAIPSVLVIYFASRLALRFDRPTQTLTAITMALSFGIVYYGAASTYVTDPLAVLLTCMGAVAVMRRRFALAGVAIGAGAALKLFPILVIPAVLVLSPIRNSIRMVLTAAAVLAASFLPGAIANFEIFASPFRWQSSRPPWESWYAFFNWLTNAPHEYLAPYFQDASAGTAFGWVFTGITPVASVLQTPVGPGASRWENTVSLLGTVVLLSACLAARPATGRSLPRWSLFCLSAFFIFGIGWSPQYELYLIPFVLLSFENPLVGAGAAVLLQTCTFLDYPLLLPWAYLYGGSAVWLEWGAVLARYLVLGWLCLFVLGSEASWYRIRERIDQLRIKQRADLTNVA